MTAPPGEESGRTDPVGDGDTALRKVGRTALFVPKLVFELAIAPVEAALFVNDRVIADYIDYKSFGSEEHGLTLRPAASYQTGFGFAAGGVLAHDHLFGDSEQLRFRAEIGGSYRETVALELTSGHRLGPLVVALGGNFDRRGSDAFYGIGNTDPGVVAYHRYQEARGLASADLLVAPQLHATGTAAVTDLHYAASDTGMPIDQIYDTAMLPGFAGGVRHVYTELELRWDTRERLSRFEPIDFHSLGSLVRPFAGRVNRIDGGTDFWRYGLELAEAIRVAPGPRAITLRLYGEAVTGSHDDVPFTELPALGGDLLRGYPFRRFRDRVATVATAQYGWDIARYVDGFVFVDAGRVFASVDEIRPEHVRFGYGVGVDLHNTSGYLVETGVASSSDGGLILSLSLNQAPDERPRWR